MRGHVARAVVLATAWFAAWAVVLDEGPQVRYAVGGVVFGVSWSAVIWFRGRRAALSTPGPGQVPAWLRETIEASPTVGLLAFVATPILVTVLAVLGVVSATVPLVFVGAGVGVLIAIWLRRTGRLS